MKKCMYSFLFLSMFAAMPLVGMEDAGDDGSGSDYEFGDEITLVGGGIGVFKSKKRPKNTEGYTKVRGLGWVKIKKEEPKSHAGGDSDRAALEKRIKDLERRLDQASDQPKYSTQFLARCTAVLAVLQVAEFMGETDTEDATLVSVSRLLHNLVDDSVIRDLPSFFKFLVEKGVKLTTDGEDEGDGSDDEDMLGGLAGDVGQRFAKKMLKKWNAQSNVKHFVADLVKTLGLRYIKVDPYKVREILTTSLKQFTTAANIDLDSDSEDESTKKKAKAKKKIPRSVAREREEEYTEEDTRRQIANLRAAWKNREEDFRDPELKETDDDLWEKISMMITGRVCNRSRIIPQ